MVRFNKTYFITWNRKKQYKDPQIILIVSCLYVNRVFLYILFNIQKMMAMLGVLGFGLNE